MNKILNKIISAVTYKFPNLSMNYRKFRNFRNKHRKATLTEHGFLLTGNKLMESGNFELEETKLIKKLITNIDIFINIGANVGYYCCFALQLKKYVVAFEPLPSNLMFLYKNMSLNNWENDIEIHPIALSDYVGITKIFGLGTGASLVSGWAGNSKNYYENVPTNTMDNLLSNRFIGKKSLILIDVEGAELNVLKGSINILKQEIKPNWFVEISVFEHQPDGKSINPNLLETFNLFWEAGYKSVIANDSLREITKLEIENIIITKNDNLQSHNFIFFDNKNDINEILK
jgi:FkbM family methyltransferase